MECNTICIDPSLEKQLTGHRNSVTALFYNRNEKQLASSSLDNSILLWDLHGTMKSYRFQGHDEAVMDVTFSPSGKYMASASRDKTVRIWVPTVTGSTGMFKAHSQTVRSVQYSPDGTKIITASDDKIIKIWSGDKHKFLASYVGHTNWVRRAAMSSDGSVIASCSDDKTTRLWNPDTAECINTYKDQNSHGMYLAWHPSSCYVAVGTSKGNVKLYDIRTHNLVQYYSVHNDAVTQIAFHPSGSYILTASKDGKMKILDLLEGHPIFTLSGHSGGVNAVTFSPSGQFFASAGDDKMISLWKTNFTELGDIKENVEENSVTRKPPNTKVSEKKRIKGLVKMWYHCYHSKRYPVTNFVHIDNAVEITNDSVRNVSFQEGAPNANSTTIESVWQSEDHGSLRPNSQNLNGNAQSHGECQSTECSAYSVGHVSHIPRTPPTPGTYTIPNFFNKSIETEKQNEGIFGMIKLGDNDVCYTSGTIEWVGRKRSFPINSGFKILSQSNEQHESVVKKVRKLNTTYTSGVDKIRECDCADVLPTVNAMVEHLNALHEAVDLVDLRLNTLEDTVSKNE
ncbi:POC1 centriolar protein homolog A-like [Maniola hyperantus]|uniref:POC1 centriolar protein homolog A-like n=1 Tax=Aphantopus hyperantus TaxID=2795564 RepID=UPI00156890AA|nr:POC1 centriolar protein homolog A-like isoform X2 [Maniola hyperantus]